MIFSFIIKRHTIYLILRNYMQITIQIKKTIAIIDILIITHGMWSGEIGTIKSILA